MILADPEEIILVAEVKHAGFRLDQFVAAMIPGCSRNTASNWIKKEMVRVENKAKKPGYRLCPGDTVTAPYRAQTPETEFVPEPVEIDTLYIDDHVIVINKPPGMVVHPAPGHLTGSLAHGLAYHFPETMDVGSEAGRPGIVHRLDKGTSGVMIAARNHESWLNLCSQFKAHTVQKTYETFVYGLPGNDQGEITLPIYRNPKDRKKMTAGPKPSHDARHAETTWRVIQRFSQTALLECHIKTGRTHQIRVHLAAVGHPVMGDPVYGCRKAKKACSQSPGLKAILEKVSRQMLHARKIAFMHPQTCKALEFFAPLPRDMQWLHQALENS